MKGEAGVGKTYIIISVVLMIMQIFKLFGLDPPLLVILMPQSVQMHWVELFNRLVKLDGRSMDNAACFSILKDAKKSFISETIYRWINKNEFRPLLVAYETLDSFKSFADFKKDKIFRKIFKACFLFTVSAIF